MRTDKIFQDIAAAPIMATVYPCHQGDTIRRFVSLLHEESYPALEILARPLKEALSLLDHLNGAFDRRQIYIGIGTVKTAQDAREIVKLKPDFLVSPAFSRRVLDVAVTADIPYIPAVFTLQDVQDVADAFEDVGRELTLLKLCPVNVLNDEYVQIMGKIFNGITFCPTGSVTLDTLAQWSQIPCAGPAMESSFIPEDLLENRQWEAIRQILRKIRRLTGKEIPAPKPLGRFPTPILATGSENK